MEDRQCGRPSEEENPVWGGPSVWDTLCVRDPLRGRPLYVLLHFSLWGMVVSE